MKKTWDEFWGEFLQIELHKDNPIRWTVREEQAVWIIDRMGLSPGARILAPGCGDGILEICMGRLGMCVTGVDRQEKVIALARNEIQDEDVEFLAADLRALRLPPGSYDAVTIIETLGLLRKEDDVDLISRVATWLKPGGRVLVDCPKEGRGSDSEGMRVSPVPGGTVAVKWGYNRASRIQWITPRFSRETVRRLN